MTGQKSFGEMEQIIELSAQITSQHRTSFEFSVASSSESLSLSCWACQKWYHMEPDSCGRESRYTPELLLLSKHQSLAVAAALQHLMKNSVPSKCAGNVEPKKWNSIRVYCSCLDFSHFVLQLLHLSKIGEMGTIPQPKIAPDMCH